MRVDADTEQVYVRMPPIFQILAEIISPTRTVSSRSRDWLRDNRKLFTPKAIISAFGEIGAVLKQSAATNWRWWSASAGIHLFMLLVLTLLLGSVVAVSNQDGTSFDAIDQIDTAEGDVPRLDAGEIAINPSVLNPNELLALQNDPLSGMDIDDNPEFVPAGGAPKALTTDDFLGGGGPLNIRGNGPGPAVDSDSNSVTMASGNSNEPGSGGNGKGFGHRLLGSGKRIGVGATPDTERAVKLGLNWLARHQNPNGSWSIDHRYRCKDGTCTVAGTQQADTGATAMALLCFLGAGVTHKDGDYQKQVSQGLAWLQKQQGKDGNLAGDSTHVMYCHGLATIVLCEAFGMTGDASLGKRAQLALRFVEMAQNETTGGWRYHPGDEGDTSVFGWQLMALKSGEMAGLQVNYSAFQGAEKWLKSVASGENGGQFAYTPDKYPTPSMTSIGLLGHQYLRMRPDTPTMAEGREYLMAHMPDMEKRDIYYWYYATQVMHNLPGPEWDKWNRSMRRILIESQCRENKRCDTGSWNPETPTVDAWGHAGGRLMCTCLSVLTLEVYYRHLPLFQIDQSTHQQPAVPQAVMVPTDKSFTEANKP